MARPDIVDRLLAFGDLPSLTQLCGADIRDEWRDAAKEIADLRAKLARAHAEIRLWREWAGDVLTGWPCVNGQPITRPVDEHRDLEGGAA